MTSKGFNIRIQGDEGATPEQTLAKATEAVRQAREKLDLQKKLEGNPAIQEYKKLMETTSSKTTPLSGRITKRKGVPRKTATKIKGAPKKAKGVPRVKKTKKSGSPAHKPTVVIKL